MKKMFPVVWKVDVWNEVQNKNNIVLLNIFEDLDLKKTLLLLQLFSAELRVVSFPSVSQFFFFNTDTLYKPRQNFAFG